MELERKLFLGRTPESARVRISEQATRYLVILAWCAIIAGGALRLVQLPTRVLFFDEAVTLLRVAGHSSDEMWHTLYDGRQRTAKELRAYGTVDDRSSIPRLISSLISEDAQHPPLFYVAEFAIVKLLGSDLVVWRILPALFGLLSIGVAFAFARDLFGDKRAGLLAAAMLAVSPVERIYSEQAREYSLLVLMTLLTTWAVVRAIRVNSPRSWALYAGALAVGLYTSPFLGYVLCAHGAFVFATAIADRRRALVLSFMAASAVALIAYAPWIYEIAGHRTEIAETNAWSGEAWPITRLAAKWIFNVGSAFFDLEYLSLRWAAVFVIATVAGAFAIFRGFRDMPVEARWVLGALIVVPAILLAGPDLVLHEHRSSVARYALPLLVGLAIAASRGLVGRPILATIVLGAGFGACTVGAIHPAWWDNDANADEINIAAVINAVPRAQVVSGIVPGSIITFARVLSDETRISLRPNLTGATYRAGEPLFVLRPRQTDLQAFGRQSGLKFSEVPFVRAQTAHNLGAQIGNSISHEMDLNRLFRAESNN